MRFGAIAAAAAAAVATVAAASEHDLKALDAKLQSAEITYQSLFTTQDEEIAKLMDQISEITQLLSFSSSHLTNDAATSSSSSPQQQHPNLLYIKIPKTASTTFQRILYTIAQKHYGYQVSNVDDGSGQSIDTCDPNGTVALANWEQHIAKYGTGTTNKLDVFGLHACLRGFMLDPKYWSSGEKPFTVTLVRNPWNHFVSSHRYYQVCCDKGLAWCQPLCGSIGDLAAFNELHCAGDYCSQQTLYMSGVGNAMGANRATSSSSSSTPSTLREFDLIMIVERFDESLALLGIKLNLPVRVLFYLAENANVLAPKVIPGMTKAMQREVKATYLKADYDTYAYSVSKFDSQLNAMTAEERVRYKALLWQIKHGNTKFRDSCVDSCKYDGFSISRCVSSCWSEVLCEMGKDAAWW